MSYAIYRDFATVFIKWLFGLFRVCLFVRVFYPHAISVQQPWMADMKMSPFREQ